MIIKNNSNYDDNENIYNVIVDNDTNSNRDINNYKLKINQYLCV